MPHDLGPAVATLEAVVGGGVEAFRLSYADAKEPSSDLTREVLESILRSLTVHVPVDVRRNPAELRRRAGGRLAIRVRVRCWVRRDMRSDGQMEFLEDPSRGDTDEITERIHQLVAARVVEEIESLT